MPTEVEILRTLLREWYEYWENNDELPAKLPDSLQVRTALVLHDPRED